MDISGINLGKVNPDKGPESNKEESGTSQTRSFNPNAQVMPSQTAHAGQAMLNMKNRKRNGEVDSNSIDEDQARENESFEIDVETIGLVRVSDEEIQRFADRVAGGILLQEKEILDTVDAFAKNEKTLRSAIASILLS